MKQSHPAKVFIIDDHPVLLAGLVALLEKPDDIEVCGTATSTESVPKVIKPPPDLFIVDIYLKTSDGFDLLKLLQQRFPQTPVMVFSMHDEVFYAERALHSGAKGYLMKSESPTQILRAIRNMLSGELYISERLKSLLFSQLDTTSPGQITNPIKKLTNRELQVIQLMGQGKNNREIAVIMNIRLKTVEAHRFRIKEKLNLRHSTELIQFAIHWVQREGVMQGSRFG